MISIRPVMTVLAAVSTAAIVNAQMPKLPPQKLFCEKVPLVKDMEEHKYTAKVGGYKVFRVIPRVSGTLEKMNFKEGGLVRKGDLLYEIEDVVYKAKVQADGAKLKQIEAELTYAKQQYERQLSLAKKEVVAVTAKEEATRLYHFTMARRAEAEANLRQSEQDLAHTKIYSPIDGRIGKSAFSTGNYITPASGLLNTVVQLEPVYVTFAISERDYQVMFDGREALLRGEGTFRMLLASGKFYPLEGSIAFADNQVDSDTGTIMLWGVMKNPDMSLTSGGLVTVYLSRKTKSMKPGVKLSSLMSDTKGHYVYLLNAENKVVRRNVQVGAIIGGRQIVDSGLKGGELVITDGTHKTMPGGDVIPVMEQEPGETGKTTDGGK